MTKKLLIALLTITLLNFSAGLALAIPQTFIYQGSSWQYQTLDTDLWPTWDTAGYNSFDWANAQWQTGNAAFGNSAPPAHSTYWQSNTDLALQQTFYIGSDLLSPLTLNVASDNGFIVFINGNEVARANSEGYTSYWEYTILLDSTPFLSPGYNLIQVLAEDHGAKTFFDLKLSGDAAPVPEPATILLLGSGISGLAFWRRRKSS